MKFYIAIPFWMSSILIFVLLHEAASNNAPRNIHASRLTQFTDVTFNQSLLFESEAGNVEECLLLCKSSCLTFTFTEVTSTSGICRGHDVEMTSSSAQTPTSNRTLVYVLTKTDWLDRRCTNSTSDPCSQRVNGTCYNGRCVCQLGLYYSTTTGECLPDCPQGRLSNSFVHYEGRRMDAHNIRCHTPIDLETCWTKCTKEPRCRTVDFMSGNNCCLQAYTSIQVPEAAFVHDNNTHHYQRGCLD